MSGAIRLTQQEVDPIGGVAAAPLVVVGSALAVGVAVGPGDGEVTVVVVDSGAGFDLDEVPDDRIGLRTSIKGRIEQEGGSVRIWSRPGVGTTVVLSVPEGGA